MKEGWVKLYRRLVDNPRFKDGDWLRVWMWMLMTATHKPHDVLFKGERITLNPGQFTAGRLQIAEKTGVSDAKVYRVIETLKSEQQIEQRISNACSLYTILNWVEYQQTEQQNEQPLNIHRTTTEQPVNTKQEGEEYKNKKKALPLDDEAWLNELQGQEIFQGVNVRAELQKMKNWCANKRKVASRRRFLNWLNNADAPLQLTSGPGRTYTDAERTLIAMGKM